MISDRLYVPSRTRLETVFRVVNPDGTVTWQVWTACQDRGAPFEKMLGTHLSLNYNGSAYRVTDRPDATTDIMEVMPHVA